MKVKIHSMVDVITNSSTVIYTYQNSVKEAKELVQEILNLSGISDKTPDDVFYYGIFCDDETYFESDDFPDDAPTVSYGDDSTKESRKKEQEIKDKWFNDLILSIIKGEIAQPEWMNKAEEGKDYWAPDSYLTLIPKDDRFKGLVSKIGRLLNSVSADGGMDG